MTTAEASGMSAELLPRGQARAEVRAEPGAPGVYEVTGEGRYPAGDRWVVDSGLDEGRPGDLRP